MSNPDHETSKPARGRPCLDGRPMTAAERKRCQRIRDHSRELTCSATELEKQSFSALIVGIQRAVRIGWPEAVEQAAAELVRRARENELRDSHDK